MFIFCVGIIGCLFCLLPAILNLDLYTDYTIDNKIGLLNSLQAREVRDSLMLSLGICIPFSIHIILDVVEDLKAGLFLPRVQKVASSLVPNLIILLIIMSSSYDYFKYIPCVLHAQSVMYITDFCSQMNLYGSSTWTFTKTLIMFSMMMVSMIIGSFEEYTFNTQKRQLFGYLEFTFFLTGIILLLHSSFKWIKKMINKYKRLNTLLSRDEIICTFNMIMSYIFIFIFYYGIYLSYGEPHFINISSSYMATVIFARGFLSCVLLVFYDRKSVKDYFVTQVCNTFYYIFYIFMFNEFHLFIFSYLFPNKKKNSKILLTYLLIYVCFYVLLP